MSQLNIDPKLAAIVVGLAFLLVAGMIITSLIVVVDTTNLPDPPAMEHDAVDQKGIQEKIKSYKEASEAIRANKSGMLELIVTKTFLPIFQALIASTLAFIFGKGLFDLTAACLGNKNRGSK